MANEIQVTIEQQNAIEITLTQPGFSLAQALDYFYTKDEVDDLLANFDLSSYYTKTEVDTLLAGKSNTGHTHDDRYFTEAEITTLLTGKSDTGHTHDDRYFTESEVTTLLAGKSDVGHTHDSRYYTESEIDAFLSAINQYSDEKVDDRVNALVIAGENLNKVYDDVLNTYTLNVEASGGDGAIQYSDNGLLTGSGEFFYDPSSHGVTILNNATGEGMAVGANAIAATSDFFFFLINTGFPLIQFGKYNGTAAAQTKALNNDTIFTFAGKGYAEDIQDYVGGAAIVMEAAEDTDQNSGGARMKLQTTAIGDTVPFDAVIIEPDGQVHIVDELRVASLSGVLKASTGVVSGGATTDDIPQGTTNKYFNESLAIAYAVAL